jgi:peptidoglycan/xylan/chitin deacetylase (PgdA/CDA1 family)
MTKHQISNLGLLVSAIIIAVLYYYFGHLTLLLAVPLIVFYISLLVMGSVSIRFNFYLTSLKRGNTNRKLVALTFDDGPDSETTEKILDILNKYNMPASFFCVGEKIKNNKEILKKTYQKGHIIGNHSYSHSKIFDLRSTKNMIKEIEETSDLIFQTIGQTPLLFRPPFGVTNPLLARAIKKTRVTSTGWSLRSWDTNGKVNKVVARLKRKVHPGDVILFHDNRPTTVEILIKFLPYLIDQGYQVIPLDELLKTKPYANN